jgi:glycosyltransferase involved in cell wall biosynthesis
VTLVVQANAGLSGARNSGMVRARGRYLWFVDSDDEITHDALTCLLEQIDRDPADVIAFEFETLGGVLDRPAYLERFGVRVNPAEFLLSGRPPSPVQFYLLSAVLIAKLDLRFHVGIYHEDALFTPQVLIGAASLIRIRTICYRYRLRQDSIMSVSRPQKHLADMITVIEQLGQRAQSLPTGDRRRMALVHEIGFALGGVRYYWRRVDRAERGALVSGTQLVPTVKTHWRQMGARSLLNAGSVLAGILRDRIGRPAWR